MLFFVSVVVSSLQFLGYKLSRMFIQTNITLWDRDFIPSRAQGKALGLGV